ncbi:MAG: T9SS type A sorting domain-containing protein [Sphingobacteriaceae bacterium]|nr:T9SS type A sorting domain-containing protein [Sphingobacteriaceae bacterium]
MKNKIRLQIIIGLLFIGYSKAQVTWADDIAAIMYSKCTSCHHVGGLAPNPLMTYAQAFNYKNLINTYVNNKYMPPWPPDAEYKHLAFERLVSASDKQKISDWVLAGAPEGNPNNAPPAPSYTNNISQLNTIDFTGKMPDYTVNTSQDLYRCFVIPTNLASDKFVSEIEVKPGNTAIVHHVLIFEDTSQIIVNKDNLDPGPGYTSFFGTGSGSSRLVGEWVPGTAPIKFPSNMGVRLKANTRLVMQVHYPGGTFNALDSTRVNIKYAPGSPREVFIAPILTETNVINPPFTIAANTIQTFTQQYTNSFPLPFTLLSVAPHMHLIGKSYKVYAIGIVNDTIPLIYIPKWDFRWQGVYAFRNPIKMGPNYKVIGETSYDNTASNPFNPNTPPQNISQGESTTEEMMQTYFAFLLYQAGDENIVVDDSPTVGVDENSSLNSIVKTLQLYEVFPNPGVGVLKMNYFAPEKLNTEASVFSVDGKLVKQWKVQLQAGFGVMQLPTENLSKGQYFVRIQTKQYSKTRTFIINE